MNKDRNKSYKLKNPI